MKSLDIGDRVRLIRHGRRLVGSITEISKQPEGENIYHIKGELFMVMKARSCELKRIR